jgi:glycosyl transferase family 25
MFAIGEQAPSPQSMDLYDYFGRIAIIHLPERTDRLRALQRELTRVGIDVRGTKVTIPDAPKPEDDGGFPSRGVHGNFLSHLGILRDALRDGLESVWVLEDDAIFSRRFVREATALAASLRGRPWDLCFLGHSLSHELAGLPRGLVPYDQRFYWSHCYAVHRRVLPRLIDYFTETMSNEPGHPRGGRVYIDGAYTLFRRLHPDVVTLVANPVLSAQRGSSSSLGGLRWYDRGGALRMPIHLARGLRDELWRWTGLTFGGAAPTDPDALAVTLAARKAAKEKTAAPGSP